MYALRPRGPATSSMIASVSAGRVTFVRTSGMAGLSVRHSVHLRVPRLAHDRVSAPGGPPLGRGSAGLAWACSQAQRQRPAWRFRSGATAGALFFEPLLRRSASASETSISSLTLRSNSGTVASGMVRQTSRSAVSS